MYIKQEASHNYPTKSYFTTLEVKTGPGWKYFYGNTPTDDINGPGWAASYVSDCTGSPACRPGWVTRHSTPALGGAHWLSPSSSSGPSANNFSYASPAINVDSNVNLATLSMRVLGAADDSYLSTGVINGSPLTLHQDNTSRTALDIASGPGTVTFAAGITFGLASMSGSYALGRCEEYAAYRNPPFPMSMLVPGHLYWPATLAVDFSKVVKA